MCRKSSGKLRTQKKRGTFSPSSVVLRSSTTCNSQLQRVKPTPYGGSVAASLWELFLKLSKFQNNQISYFAFSYSMVCITELCGFAHRRFVSLLLILFNFGCKYNVFCLIICFFFPLIPICFLQISGNLFF